MGDAARRVRQAAQDARSICSVPPISRDRGVNLTLRSLPTIW